MSDERGGLAEIEAERRRIRDVHLRPAGERPASTARGLHHTAMISSDVDERPPPPPPPNSDSMRFCQSLKA